MATDDMISFSWNSSIFSTVQTNQYTVVVVSPDFLSNGSTVCTKNSTALDCLDGLSSMDNMTCPIVGFIRDGYLAGNYTKLSPNQCISTYANTFITGHRNVIAVMNTSSPDANYYLWPDSVFNGNDSTLDWPGTSSVPIDMQVPTPNNDTSLVSIFNPELWLSGWGPFDWLCNYYNFDQPCTMQQAQSFGNSWKITPAE